MAAAEERGSADCSPEAVAHDLVIKLAAAPHHKLKVQQDWFVSTIQRCGEKIVSLSALLATMCSEMYQAGRSDAPHTILNCEVYVDNSKKVEIYGDVSNSVVGIDQVLENVRITVQAVQNKGLQQHLDALRSYVEAVLPKIEGAKAKDVAEDLEAFVREAARPAPRKGMLDVTRDGLLEAAKTVQEMAPHIAATIASIYAIFHFHAM